MKIDLHKGAQQVSGALGKAAEIGKAAADKAQVGAQALAVKAQEENQKAQLKKYNPVFPEQYQREDFAIPNLVKIVDDAVRKDVEVCQGAIGWRDKQKGVEVFYLYDEAIESSGLHFIPAPVCDSIYYVDPHDRSRFIRLDCYFDKMQESRLAELQQIAYSLGAKRYSVEMEDAASDKKSASQKASMKKKDGFGLIKGKAEAQEERSATEEKAMQRKSVAYAEFAGERQPTAPALRWFAHDDNIRNLIHMRCSGTDTSGMKNYTMEFKSSDFATIGASTAAAIDGALGKISGASGFTMQSKVVEERSRKLIFQVEF